MRTIPTDSTDARELRELEQAHTEEEAAEQRRHDAECVGGWRGEDAEGRPRACTVCRPHLAHVACRTCSAPWQSCTSLRSIHRGRCCDSCDHSPMPERNPDAPQTPPAKSPEAPRDAAATSAEVRRPRAGAGQGGHPVPRDPRHRTPTGEADATTTGDHSVTAPVLPVRLPDAPVRIERPDRLLLVADPQLGDIPVRWRLTPGHNVWRCGACGPQSAADCVHAFAAGIYLAESLLGLTARPEFTTRSEGNTP